MYEYDFILRCKRMEFIFCCDKFNTCQFGYFFCSSFCKALRCIQTCANSCAAKSQFCHFNKAHFNHFFAFFQHISPAADFLRECDGCSILQMSSACFYDTFIFFFQSFKFSDHSFHCRDQFVFCFQNRCNMHSCGECIIGALAHIYMVIGMKQFFSGNFIASVCNHFIHIHIGLSATTGLPYHQRELIIQFACQHFIAHLSDDLTSFCIQFSQSAVCLCYCLFQNRKSICDFLRHFFRTNFEIFKTSLGLCAPICIHGYFHFAH